MLRNINGHDSLQSLTDAQRTQLCREIREFLISHVSKTGGHLAANLGIVELSVAIETVFNTASDRLVFDVGHQSYVHKLLTGRQEEFGSLRQYGGISGFPKPSESESDAFVAGHASSSVSIALGMARARTLLGQNHDVVALIGDGACTGGMVYEGLNDAGVSGESMIVILNDNEMSIDRNVGGLSTHLSRLRTNEGYLGAKRLYRKAVKKLPFGKQIYVASSRVKNRMKSLLLNNTMFEDMGFVYLGPASGHDLPGMIALLKKARELRCPVLVHVVTKKGCGYGPAEENPSKFHGIGPFDPVTGEVLAKKVTTYSKSFGDCMVSLAREDHRVCAITAAMPGGTGLLDFQNAFPGRTFDVGIAEEHAVSMAGGLAKAGMKPVVALYSTFLQRGYDQILQDIALQQLPVVLAIDRAGLVGDDGPTHHGVFDVGFLRQVPGMTVLVPGSLAEQQQMLRWAVKDSTGPVAIRYPRGGENGYSGTFWQGMEGELVCTHRTGSHVTIVTYGNLLKDALEAADILSTQGIEATLVRLLCVNKLPLQELSKKLIPGAPVFVAEEVAANCGIRDSLAHSLPDFTVTGRDLGDDFVTHGARDLLLRDCGLDGVSLAQTIKKVLSNEN
ncbi:MAG: 1-deoxy-D-xylulose-5-phosphate synthase [Oscillospiraceae bacterium]|nr:1-deoxy-D-xylulose-5-phosphate synthase [Oscillospiraceae bacterium]